MAAGGARGKKTCWRGGSPLVRGSVRAGAVPTPTSRERIGQLESSRSAFACAFAFVFRVESATECGLLPSSSARTQCWGRCCWSLGSGGIPKHADGGVRHLRGASMPSSFRPCRRRRLGDAVESLWLPENSTRERHHRLPRCCVRCVDDDCKGLDATQAAEGAAQTCCCRRCWCERLMRRCQTRWSTLLFCVSSTTPPRAKQECRLHKPARASEPAYCATGRQGRPWWWRRPAQEAGWG